MHENFLSRWLRKDEDGKVEEKGSFRTGAKQGVNTRAGKDRLKEKTKRLSLTVKESVWEVCLNRL